MRKFLPYITGVILGIATSIVIIGAGTAMGEDDGSNWWDKTIAGAETWEWKNVFGESFGDTVLVKDLYRMMHNKLLVSPGDKALDEMAKKYDLTKEEAEAIINGSLTTVYHNFTGRKAGNIEQEEAIAITEAFLAEYEEMRELFDLAERMDAEIAPSEIFSNGDLEDSGFDLVYDLDVIEQILFLNVTEPSVGGPFELDIDSPVVPGSTGSGSTIGGTGGSGSGSESVAYIESPITYNGDTASIEVGGVSDPIVTPILDDDVCPDDDDILASALDEYNSEVGDSGKHYSQGQGEGDDGDEGGSGDEESGGSGDNSTPVPEKINSAYPSEWGSTFCPELNGEGGGDSNVLTASDTLGLAEVPYGAQSSYEAEGFSANATICITLEMISGKVTAERQETSCVECEVEKINSVFEETLLHSLSPNKVTGNIMESAKCSNAMSFIGTDLKVIPIFAPIQTPPNDDLIFDQNIFESWNKFVDKLGYAQLKADDKYTEEYSIRYASPDMSQAALINEISEALTVNTNKAEDIGNASITAQDIADTLIYSQTVLRELQQMRAYFEIFKGKYEEIYSDPCAVLRNVKKI